MKKRFLAFILLCCFFCPVRAQAAEFSSVSARAAALYDPLTGQFLFEQNGDEQLPMASTTKIMTAIIALEKLNLEEKVTIRREWVGIEGSSMYLKEGETLLVSDLLYGLLLMSGNDAAVALASLCSGSEKAFVTEMNIYAQKLGLLNTHFESASGLDGAAHYSTAKDMAKLADYALRQQAFYQIVSTESISVAGRWMTNHNKLLRICEGVCGVKTGFTKKAGRCLVSACERGGRRVIFVTLHAPDDWQDHQNIYRDFFDDCHKKTIFENGIQAEIPISSGGRVSVYSNLGYALSLTKEEEETLKVKICGDRLIYGDVSAGDVYGIKKVLIKGKVVAEIPLYYSNGVGAETPDGFWQRLIRRWK